MGRDVGTGVVPARESKSGGTVTEKDEKKGNGLPFFGIDPAGKSPEQIEREWFEQYYRTGIPQLTARAVLVGAFLGVVMSLSTLYVGLKTGVGSCHHRLYSVFLHRHCPEKNRGLQQQPQSPQRITACNPLPARRLFHGEHNGRTHRGPVDDHR